MDAAHQLLERVHRFDEQALTEVYDLFSPSIFRYAVRLLGDSNLAEECIAETFYRFLKALHHGNGPKDHLQAYLYRVAHNWITDTYRRNLPDFSVDSNLVAETEDDQQVDPLEAAAQAQERRRVRAALASLTSEQRQVIVLKYLEGWNNEQVAQALDRPVGAIKSLQHRALDALRRLLVKKEIVSNDHS